MAKTLAGDLLAHMHVRCNYTIENLSLDMHRDPGLIVQIMEEAVKDGIVVREGDTYRKLPKKRQSEKPRQIDWVGRRRRPWVT